MKKIFTVVAILISFAILFAGVSFAVEATGGAEKAKTEAPVGKIYVCEACKVTMDAPGKCPVCGMELIEKTETIPAAPAAEKPAEAPAK